MPASHNSIATNERSMFWAACAGAQVMAVGMGFSRFAYTGVYPVMVNEGLLTVQDGTLAASANYAGYLFGALFAAKLASHQARRWVLISIAGSILCMFALALTATPWAVVVIRGLAGILSALCMIAASLWLLQHHGYQRGAPLLFAGVGVGIFASAELLALGQYFGFKSPALWLVLGVGAVARYIILIQVYTFIIIQNHYRGLFHYKVIHLLVYGMALGVVLYMIG